MYICRIERSFLRIPVDRVMWDNIAVLCVYVSNSLFVFLSAVSVAGGYRIVSYCIGTVSAGSCLYAHIYCIYVI